MDIEVVDNNRVDNGFLTSARNRHPNAVIAENVSSMVDGIIERLRGETIGVLRIFGHAAPGEQGLGNSESTQKDEQLIQIDSRGHLTNRAQLLRLRKYFTSNSLVELHGCNVAGGHRGRELLRQLAHLWNVRVRGGVETQYSDINPANAIEGPIIQATPNGPGAGVRQVR